MAKPESKNIATPDETRTFPNGRLELVTLGEFVFGRATFEPGWRWSESVKPVAGTDSCLNHHNGYIESGRIHISFDDGTEVELGPGDVYVAPPGHDAWVVGDEPCVTWDFSSQIAGYAK